MVVLLPSLFLLDHLLVLRREREDISIALSRLVEALKDSKTDTQEDTELYLVVYQANNIALRLTSMIVNNDFSQWQSVVLPLAGLTIIYPGIWPCLANLEQRAFNIRTPLVDMHRYRDAILCFMRWLRVDHSIIRVPGDPKAV